MYTINDIRKMLGLSTTNQVRNRIEAVKSLLAGELRRGPNNQILITEEGLGILKRLQELYDSGLTIAQASDVLRSKYDFNEHNATSDLSGFRSNRENRSASEELVRALRDEISFLRTRIAYLEEQLRGRAETGDEPVWWEELREEIDGA